MRLIIVRKLTLSILSLLLLLFPVSCGQRGSAEHIHLQPLPRENVPLTRADSVKRNLFSEYFSRLYTRGGFNGNVLLASKGKLIFEGCFGYADHKEKIELTPETGFQLASVSKQFTAAGILILMEKGFLQLDDPVEKFIPGFPYKGITIRLLLEHRSGLFNYIYFCDGIVKEKDKPISNEEVLRLINLYRPKPYYEPNRTFNYSNTGYIILASIIEKVSKMPYASFLKKEIFDPLGMKNTTVVDHHQNKTSELAKGYKGGWRTAPVSFLDGVVGDKGIYSSIIDLYKWDRALYSDEILSRNTINLAFQPHGKALNSKRNYGFGWRIDHLPDSTKVLYHTGWWEGFQTLLVRVEKDSTTLIVLKNRKSGHIDRIGMLKMLYPKSFPGESGKNNGMDDEEEAE